MDKEKNNASFIEKFMVRSNYEIFKFGGYTLKNKDRGMKLMLQYFSEYLQKNNSKRICRDTIWRICLRWLNLIFCRNITILEVT